MKYWYVYVVRCQDGSLYTGITTNLQRRIVEHNSGPAAAAYTRSRRPVTLVYQERVLSRSAAAKREAEIKRMEKPDKEDMISGASGSDQDNYLIYK